MLYPVPALHLDRPPPGQHDTAKEGSSRVLTQFLYDIIMGEP